MKTYSSESLITIPFDDIFYYAKEHYGISWNDANDLFFRNEIMEYGRLKRLNVCELPFYVTTDGKIDLSKENVEKMDDCDKARCILIKFFEDHNITGDVLIDSQ